MSNLQTATPQMTIHNNTIQTTSRNIAEVFGKRHSDVLRDIEALEVPEKFTERNFALSEYRAGNRTYKMHEITRDGFTLLAMGFTGKKAMQFKLAYIAAFNAMEAELLKKYKQAALPDTINPAQQKQLLDAVTNIVIANYGKSRSERSKGFHHEWGQLKTAFKVAEYKQIPSDKFDNAMAFLLGEWVPEETMPAIPSDMVMVNKTNLEALLKLNAMSADIYNQRIQEIERMTTELSASVSDFRMKSWDAVRDGAWVAKTLSKEIAENHRCI